MTAPGAVWSPLLFGPWSAGWEPPPLCSECGGVLGVMIEPEIVAHVVEGAPEPREGSACSAWWRNRFDLFFRALIGEDVRPLVREEPDWRGTPEPGRNPRVVRRWLLAPCEVGSEAIIGRWIPLPETREEIEAATRGWLIAARYAPGQVLAREEGRPVDAATLDRYFWRLVSLTPTPYRQAALLKVVFDSKGWEKADRVLRYIARAIHNEAKGVYRDWHRIDKLSDERSETRRDDGHRLAGPTADLGLDGWTVYGEVWKVSGDAVEEWDELPLAKDELPLAGKKGTLDFESSTDEKLRAGEAVPAGAVSPPVHRTPTRPSRPRATSATGDWASDPDTGEDVVLDAIDEAPLSERRNEILKSLEEGLTGDQRALYDQFARGCAQREESAPRNPVQVEAASPEYTVAQAGRDLGWTEAKTKAVHVALHQKISRLATKLSG